MSERSWEDGTDPGVTIVEAVADASGRRPRDLPPLQRAVDVDALEALLTGDGGTRFRVEFRYADVHVVVDRDAVVASEPAAETGR
ncbi:HalOD1 output domain-containing protein [Halobaculum sp. EA56]|uniref:HalOD1 output domain-containing protein n=1 Tax=Halobaculum sp. EA56 TaxID=3421648 RepID=UPI003EBB2CD1